MWFETEYNYIVVTSKPSYAGWRFLFVFFLERVLGFDVIKSGDDISSFEENI